MFLQLHYTSSSSSSSSQRLICNFPGASICSGHSSLEKMKKVVLKLHMHDDKCKKKAMTKVSGLAGVESIDMNSKDGKLTVTGDVDAVEVADKLRKICHTEIVSVGPAKEEKKPEAPKPGKEDSKKDPKDEYAAWFLKTYGYHPATFYYHQPPATYGGYYRPVPAEEDPNGCVIC